MAETRACVRFQFSNGGDTIADRAWRHDDAGINAGRDARTVVGAVDGDDRGFLGTKGRPEFGTGRSSEPALRSMLTRQTSADASR